VCGILESAFEINEFDGFDLSFRPKTATKFDVPRKLKKGYSGTYSFEWRRSDAPLNGTVYWQLSMALVSENGQQSTFTVYRSQSSRNLFFDINLLTGEFQSVLAEAVDRAIGGKAHSVELEKATPITTPLKSMAASSSQ
jgi:hypothetical protein